jgi:hypothetical protein
MEFTKEELDTIVESLLQTMPTMIDPYKRNAANAIAKIRIKQRITDEQLKQLFSASFEDSKI